MNFRFFKELFSGFLPAIGLFLTIIKLMEFFFPNRLLWLQSNWVFAGLIVCSFTYSLYINFPYRTARFRISGTDAYISIRIGDILLSDENIVIPTSNFFNTSPEIVAPNTLLGQYLKKYYNNDTSQIAKTIDRDIEKSLAHVKGEHVEVRKGKTISYPLCTVAAFKTPSNKKAFLISITKITENHEIRVESNISYIHQALDNLWNRTETELDNGILHITPFGSGVSRAFNKTTESIIYIAQNFIDRAKRKRPCSELVIFIKHGSVNQIEYLELRKIIKFLAQG